MKVEDIEGIGHKYGEMLRKEGINSPSKLLAAGSTVKGRRELAQKTGIDDGRILKWVNLCDLCRISGISTQYSELLEAAGVDTVKELRNRRADNLAGKMQEVNAARKLVRVTPSLKNVSNWVEQAKSIEPAVSY